MAHLVERSSDACKIACSRCSIQLAVRLATRTRAIWLSTYIPSYGAEDLLKNECGYRIFTLHDGMTTWPTDDQVRHPSLRTTPLPTTPTSFLQTLQCSHLLLDAQARSVFHNNAYNLLPPRTLSHHQLDHSPQPQHQTTPTDRCQPTLMPPKYVLKKITGFSAHGGVAVPAEDTPRSPPAWALPSTLQQAPNMQNTKADDGAVVPSTQSK